MKIPKKLPLILIATLLVIMIFGFFLYIVLWGTGKIFELISHLSIVELATAGVVVITLGMFYFMKNLDNCDDI